MRAGKWVAGTEDESCWTGFSMKGVLMTLLDSISVKSEALGSIFTIVLERVSPLVGAIGVGSDLTGGEAISVDWDWLIIGLIMVFSVSDAIVGGVEKSGVFDLTVGVVAMPCGGRDNRGEGVRVRNDVWTGDNAANRASRVLRAESWIRCLRVEERVFLMVTWLGKRTGSLGKFKYGCDWVGEFFWKTLKNLCESVA